MLKYYIRTTEALKRLRTDQDGVVSFEYIIVAACIIGAVAAAFGTGATGAIGTALRFGFGADPPIASIRMLHAQILDVAGERFRRMLRLLHELSKIIRVHVGPDGIHIAHGLLGRHPEHRLSLSMS